MERSKKTPERTIGLDVTDRKTHLCELDRAGELVEESRFQTTEAALSQALAGRERSRRRG